MPFNDNLPAQGTQPWYTPFATAWNNLKTFVNGLETRIDEIQPTDPTWDDITDKPTSFPPSAHTHATADVTGLDAALAGKASTASVASKADASALTQFETETVEALDDLTDAVALKANATDVTTALASKASTADLTTGLAAKANATDVTSGLAGKANTVHTHAIADVTNLQSSLDGKAPTVHTHAIGNVTGLQSALDGKAATSQIVVLGVLDFDETPPAPGVYLRRPAP